MTPLAQAISGALVQFVWQGFLTAFFVSAAAFLLRKRSPNARYLVYCLGLLILAALPVVTAIALYDPQAENPGPAAFTLTIQGVWNGSVSPAALSLEHWLNASQVASQTWILRLWIVGVIFLSLRLAWLGVRVSALRRSGTQPDTLILALANAMARRMGMRRAVRVLVSALPDGPGVAGWIRPVIFLPAATILNLAPDQLEAILAHEIAHLRRYDDLVNLAQSLIETLLFYHPAVWWVSNRIRHERELCCDDLAVRASGNALCYARALTALERLRVSPASLSLAALGTSGSPLEYRIRRIVDARGRQDYIPSGLPGLLALSLALISVAIYSSSARGSAPAPPPLVEYPESARINGIQGTVPVQVKIDQVGHVSDAKAIGGPKELRQAAVQSASALHFAPDVAALPASQRIDVARVDVAFQLTSPVPVQAPPLQQTPAVQPSPARPALRWLDQGEYEIGIAADREKDPAKKLELLKRWEQQYPSTDLRYQRTYLTAQTLMAMMQSASGKTDPAVLDVGKKAGRQLADHLNEYFSDSVKPAAMPPEQWAKARKDSELRIHAVLALIAQTESDYDTAETELKRSLEIDPDQAGTSWQLGKTILQEMATNNEVTRYSEAIYVLARSLTVTGPAALPPELKALAESALRENYGSYHGSADGLDNLMKLAGSSALPPAGFHIISAVELNHTAWATAHPDLDLWETTRTALLEHGDARFQDLNATIFRATVVSQPSPNRLIVNIDNIPAGDAVLRFDGGSFGAIPPGAVIHFKGVADSWNPDPYTLTFVVRSLVDNPKPRGLTRIFKYLRHLYDTKQVSAPSYVAMEPGLHP
jgi:beta-lactamase regulating signal transducer with metallopeptidase domain